MRPESHSCETALSHPCETGRGLRNIIYMRLARQPIWILRSLLLLCVERRELAEQRSLIVQEPGRLESYLGAELSVSASMDVLEAAREARRLDLCAEARLLDRGLNDEDIWALRQRRDKSIVIVMESFDGVVDLLADWPGCSGVDALAEDREGVGAGVARKVGD